MKVIFDIVITPLAGGGQTMRKIVDLPSPPYIGMGIESSAWNSPREVKAVTLNIDADDGKPCAHVPMELVKVDSREQLQEYVKMYQAHGWKSPSLDD